MKEKKCITSHSFDPLFVFEIFFYQYDFLYWNKSKKKYDFDALFFFVADLVPSPVVNLEITKVTNTSLEFQWERPCFPNGNITNYRVEYRNKNGMVNHNQTLALAGKLEKLHPYQIYSINVSACTRSGCSNSENVKNRTLVGSKYVFNYFLYYNVWAVEERFISRF